MYIVTDTWTVQSITDISV